MGSSLAPDNNAASMNIDWRGSQPAPLGRPVMTVRTGLVRAAGARAVRAQPLMRRDYTVARIGIPGWNGDVFTADWSDAGFRQKEFTREVPSDMGAEFDYVR